MAKRIKFAVFDFLIKNCLCAEKKIRDILQNFFNTGWKRKMFRNMELL